MRRSVMLTAAATVGLIVAPAASAGPLDQLYAPIHVNPKSAPSPAYINSHFKTITINDSMAAKSSYHVPNIGWYVKGSRSSDAGFPESWYLHGKDGKRS